MKKKRSWRFSQGGGALFVLLLLAPSFVGLVRRWPTNGASQWWAWPLFLALLLFFAVLIWFISLRPLIRQRLWKIPRSWYEACFGIGILYTFFALFTFVTGYTPSNIILTRCRGPLASYSYIGQSSRLSSEAPPTFTTDTATPKRGGDEGPHRARYRAMDPT